MRKPEAKSLSEDLVVDGRIILKRNFKKYDEDVDFTDPVRDSDKWRAIVDAIMNLQFL